MPFIETIASDFSGVRSGRNARLAFVVVEGVRVNGVADGFEGDEEC